MSEPLEKKLAARVENGLGPLISKWESLVIQRVPIWSLAGLIYLTTAAWWLCWLYHPHFERFGFLEMVCLDVMTVVPFANVVLLFALAFCAARSQTPVKGWLLLAVVCTISPWPLWFAAGGVGGRAGFYVD